MFLIATINHSFAAMSPHSLPAISVKTSTQEMIRHLLRPLALQIHSPFHLPLTLSIARSHTRPLSSCMTSSKDNRKGFSHPSGGKSHKSGHPHRQGPFAAPQSRSKMTKAPQGFYAVAKGRVVGIYTSWDECKAQVEGFSGPIYQKFRTWNEAQAFIVERSGLSSFGSTGTAQQAPPSTASTSSGLSKSSGGFYAVAKGLKTGVYTSWAECQVQVQGCPSAVYQKFPSLTQAQAFLAQSSTTTVKAVAGPFAGPSLPEGSQNAALNPVVDVDVDEATAGDLSSHYLIKRGYTVEDDHLVVWTDGASKGNGQQGARAGLGVYWGDRGEAKDNNLAERLPGMPQTNNRAELLAIIRALETCRHTSIPLEIRTDSRYSISSLTQYIPKWMQNNFKTATGGDVKNKDMIVHLVTLLKQRGSKNGIKFTYVKAHVGIKGNEEADALANIGAFINPIPTRRHWLTLADMAEASRPRPARISIHSPESGSKPLLVAEEDNKNQKGTEAVQGEDVTDIEFEIDPSWLLTEEELANLDETEGF